MTPSEKKTLLARVIGWLLSVIFFMWTGFTFLMDWVGRSTALEDFQQLQERLPAILEWLYQTPWYVPAGLAALLSAVVIWLNRPQHRISTITTDEARRLGLDVPGGTVDVGGAQKTSLRLFYRDGDTTPDLVSQENLFRYYSLTFLTKGVREDGEEITMGTTTALWVMYDKPVTAANVRVRVPAGLGYEIKDFGPRHVIVLFLRMPSNATVEVETY
ncbi:MAG TPA: hypothetical protein DIC56_13995 [Rhizobium sp.]|nr:hypothetical protein [Rhizobium sp.]